MNLLEESENIILFNVEKNGESLEEFLFNHEISGRLFRKI